MAYYIPDPYQKCEGCCPYCLKKRTCSNAYKEKNKYIPTKPNRFIKP